MTTIARLPDEMLLTILHDPSLRYRDVKAAGETCRRWAALCSPILANLKSAAEIRASRSNINSNPSLSQVVVTASSPRAT